jgi:hypothetical protein
MGLLLRRCPKGAVRHQHCGNIQQRLGVHGCRIGLHRPSLLLLLLPLLVHCHL